MNVGIYGEGVRGSPHFLSSPMTTLEIFKKWPKLLGPHDIAELMRTGQIRYDETLGKLVAVEPKVEAAPVVAKKPKRKGKR